MARHNEWTKEDWNQKSGPMTRPQLQTDVNLAYTLGKITKEQWGKITDALSAPNWQEQYDAIN